MTHSTQAASATISFVAQEGISLRLEEAQAILDLICTLAGAGEVDTLDRDTLYISTHRALGLVTGAREILGSPGWGVRK